MALVVVDVPKIEQLHFTRLVVKKSSQKNYVSIQELLTQQLLKFSGGVAQLIRMSNKQSQGCRFYARTGHQKVMSLDKTLNANFLSVTLCDMRGKHWFLLHKTTYFAEKTQIKEETEVLPVYPRK